MNIQLSEHFTYKKLLRFILPSIIMMVFTSIYSVVDGIFVSNFVGKSAFASVNLIMPYLMGISALGFMIGTGGSAFVSKTLGEGKKELANQYLLYPLRTDLLHIPDRLHAAECLPEFLCGCWKTPAWTESHCGCRLYKHCSRCPVHRCITLWNCRRRVRNHDQ